MRSISNFIFFDFSQLVSHKSTMTGMTTAQGFLVLLLGALVATTTHAYSPIPPKISPATNLPNELFTWKSEQQIRYQCAGPEDGEPVLLVHGLFVNSDHWRKTILRLADEGYRAYAIDLWGCGYSSKPPRDSEVAKSVCGENGRFSAEYPKVLAMAELGSSCGTKTRSIDVELTHPLQSPYNFYTWANLITDFCTDVIKPKSAVTLVSNSIGTISSLQAVIDKPDLFRGVFVVSPNFRELHSAEIAAPQLSMPIVRWVQQLLRDKGQGLFDALAKPETVKQILKEPYAVESAVDDVLVDVLLTPLLTEGASQVVFDTLSYSAGPLPEIQLGEITKPVWICYGKEDPWTPAGRVEALLRKPTVEKVVAFDNVGHCPHDEAPELVEPLLLEYLKRVCNDEATKETAAIAQ
jgi:pimeloyl-ACP methyl ester carboxylesterase